MNEPRDEALSRVYREAEAPGPPQRIDDAILAASRRAAGSRPRASSWSAFGGSWRTPVALAATVVVTFTLTLMVFERRSDLEMSELSTQLPAVPATKSSSAEDKLAKLSSEPAAKSEILRERRERAKDSAPTRADAGAQRDESKEKAAASGPALGAASPAVPPREPLATPEAALASQLYQADKARPMRDSRVHGTVMPRQPEQLAGPGERPSVGVRGLSGVAPTPELQQAPPQLLAKPEAAPPAAAMADGISPNAIQLGPLPAAKGGASVSATGYPDPEVMRSHPELWLEQIRRLKAQGNKDELKRELDEFKRRYPDYRLPDDLR